MKKNINRDFVLHNKPLNTVTNSIDASITGYGAPAAELECQILFLQQLIMTTCTVRTRKYHTYPEQPYNQVNFVYYMDIDGTSSSETSKFSIRFESSTNRGHVS